MPTVWPCPPPSLRIEYHFDDIDPCPVCGDRVAYMKVLPQGASGPYVVKHGGSRHVESQWIWRKISAPGGRGSLTAG
jgi:hypothetical protein